jgi:ATP/maltotriose-dependent transcriptional regulator MalT
LQSDRARWWIEHERFETLWLAKRFEEALAAAEAGYRAARIAFGSARPASLRALIDLALACESTGDVERSDRLLKEAEALGNKIYETCAARPADPLHAELLLMEAEQLNSFEEAEVVRDRLQKAIEVLKEMPEEKELRAEALARLAEWHFLQGGLELAGTFYRESYALSETMEESPWYLKSMLGLAHTLHQKNQSADAIAYFDKVEKKESFLSPQLKYAYLAAYAEALEKNGRSEDAARRRREAAALLPEASSDAFEFKG